MLLIFKNIFPLTKFLLMLLQAQHYELTAVLTIQIVKKVVREECKERWAN